MSITPDDCEPTYSFRAARTSNGVLLLGERCPKYPGMATAEGRIGLDWTSLEPLQAAMKVALRRTLIKFGVEPVRAQQMAEKLVSWLKTNAATIPEGETAA